MDPSPVLTQLCTICHVAQPKYRCPRCSTKTCSLKCVQKHKQWSDCSGKRDPGAHVPRRELATAASFDRDYNFLTGVERYLGSSTTRAREMHALADSAASRSSKVAEFARERNVRIVRAPKGMSRGAVNQTRWNNTAHCISWTVEFIQQDGTREMTCCNDREAVAQVYAGLLRNGPRTPREGGGVKRKGDGAKGARRSKAAKGGDGDGEEEEAALEGVAAVETEAGGGGAEQSTGDAAQQDEQPVEQPVEQPARRFFLVKPLTSGTDRVLVPLAPDAKVGDSLADQTILEFPTYQVIDSLDDPLPQGLILEADYQVKQKQLVDEMERELGPMDLDAKQEALRERQRANLDGAPNDQQILASIQKDFGGGV